MKQDPGRSTTRTLHGIRSGLLLLLVVGATSATAQQQLTTDVTEAPGDAVFVYRDIENFILATEAMATGVDSSEALTTRYLDQASPGLRMFIQKYGLTAERLLKAMGTYREDYLRLGETLEVLRAEESSFRSTYAALKRAIPDAVFPPTYFLVESHRGIGSGSIEGPLISVEKKTAESIRGHLQATLVHEMVHMEQLAAVGEAYFVIFSGDERTLLALSIREGVATYFAEVVAGGSEHKNRARDYYLARERDLWPAFRADMLGHETGDWFWSSPADPDQPRDLGYAIGARIVEAYLQGAADRRSGTREIMSVTDYPAFLARSGYVEMMERSSAPE